MSRLFRKRCLCFENLEGRRVMAASLGWDGPGQGSSDLTYHITNVPSSFSLSQDQVESAIKRALDVWSQAADISFKETSQPGLRDSIDISFRNLDGAGGTLAQAYFPDDVNPDRIAGDIEFDVSERFEIGNSQGSRAFDFVQVAVHEIGHALGLEHSRASGSVLASTVSPNQQFVALGVADTVAIQLLYAPAANPEPPTLGSTNTLTPNTSIPGTPAVPDTTVPDVNIGSNPTVNPSDKDSDPSDSAPDDTDETEDPSDRRPWWRFVFNNRGGRFQFNWEITTLGNFNGFRWFHFWGR